MPEAKVGPIRATAGKLTIRFGLVGVEVGMTPLFENGREGGHRVCPEHHTRTGQKVVCKHDGHELQVSSCLTGFEVADKLVTFTEEELSALSKDAGTTISLDRWVSDGIDPIYFEQSYLIFPQPGNEEAFDMLAAVL